MSAKKKHRSRARTSGRVTPKGVRPAGHAPRVRAGSAKPTADTDPTVDKRPNFGSLEGRREPAAQRPARPLAVRSLHLDKGHRGGR